MEKISTLTQYIPSLLTLTFIVYHIIKGIKLGVIVKIMSILALVVIIFATKMLTPIVVSALYNNGIINKVPAEYQSAIGWGVSIILFVGLNISTRLIIKLFGYLSDIPVIGPLNKILGGLFGMVESILYLWIIFFIIRLLSPFPIFEKIATIIQNNEWLNSIYAFNPLQYFAK